MQAGLSVVAEIEHDWLLNDPTVGYGIFIEKMLMQQDHFFEEALPPHIF